MAAVELMAMLSTMPFMARQRQHGVSAHVRGLAWEGGLQICIKLLLAAPRR